MKEAVDEVLEQRRHDPAGLRRIMSISFAVHVSVVAFFLLVPRNWLFAEREPLTVMTISLGGTPGPAATGMTPIGARPVETVAPEPKRPEPVRPATVTKDVMMVPVKGKTPPKQAVDQTVDMPVTMAAAKPKPTTGKQVTTGTSLADTGAIGQGTGLTFGGGGAASDDSLDVIKFCCPEYATEIIRRIQANWQQAQAERGETTLTFTIIKDGTISGVELKQSSNSTLLDNEARRALRLARFPPLPKEYTGTTLKINLKFQYEVR